MPEAVIPELRGHLVRVKALYEDFLRFSRVTSIRARMDLPINAAHSRTKPQPTI